MLEEIKIRLATIVKVKEVDNNNILGSTLYTFYREAKKSICIIFEHEAININTKEIYEIIDRNYRNEVETVLEPENSYVYELEKFKIKQIDRDLLNLKIIEALSFYENIKQLEKEGKIINFKTYKKKKLLKK